MMKHMMTHTHRQILRALTLMLALAMLLSLSALPAYAEAADTQEAESYMTWQYSASISMVYGVDPETNTSYRYGEVTMLSPRVQFKPNAFFQYANMVELADGSITTITSPAFGSDFILLGNGTLMATNAGKKYLAELATARYGFSEYRLVSDSLVSYVDEEFYQNLQDSLGLECERLSLFSLRNMTYYTILGFDECGWFGVPVAFIFEMEDGLYFASASHLDESCYDEEGKLQPKSNTNLSLYPLPEEMTDEAYDHIRDLTFRIPSYTYEDGSSFMGNHLSGEASKSDIYATVIVAGLLLPIAPITLGLCLSRSEKLGRKRRWYLLSALGAAWLVLGLGILILMAVLL